MNLIKGALLTILSAGLFFTSPIYAKNEATSSDAKITASETNSLATIAAIDKMEILLSIVAKNKKPSSGVNDFAQMMIDQHGDNLTQILTMANQLHAMPLKSPMDDKMRKEAAAALIQLGGLTGEQFDKAYVDIMVKGHEAALKLIDDKLLKTAKSEEIKNFITDTRGAVVNHLEHAKALQEKMKS